MKRILIIQTAFIGDVILATVLIEKLHDLYPKSEIDFLLRKGNESLLVHNDKVHNILIWDKKQWKYFNLFKTIVQVRDNQYDLTINLQRFASSGILSCLSGSKVKVGFKKNPLSFCFHYKIEHEIGNGRHEVERNLDTLDFLGGHRDYKPKIYYSLDEKIKRVDTTMDAEQYVVIAPGSVWYTKQFPLERWVELVKKIPSSHYVFIIGSPDDYDMCREIMLQSGRENIQNLSHKFTLLESAALMKKADMNFVNDSAPMHLASAMNAPTTAIYCSTIPEFGFGPLADDSRILQVAEKLDCRPCGLHGFKKCPKGHFDCAYKIALPDNLL